MKAEVTIRLAAAADLDAVVRLAVAFRDHQRQSWPSESQFREAFGVLLSDGATDVVLAHDATSAPLGYVMTRYRYSAWIPGCGAEIEDVFVQPVARRTGIARRLVAVAIARAEERGCRLVSLTTNERNEAALALYRQFGFRAERDGWQGARALWLERWREGG